MIKIGVLGAGHLGKIHLRLLKEIPDFELTGFYDPDPEKSAEVEAAMGVKSFPSLEELIDAVDAVDIVTPTLSHFSCAERSLKKTRHIFIEKPLTNTLEEAKQLVKLVEEAGVKAQVGHVERFNPAFLAARKLDLKPVFIESHRLAQFNPRGTDVSVILDLMIHDIDIIINLIKSPVKTLAASGVEVISDNPDIASARVEFENGCVANITASRVSLKNERKMRLFQRNAYITIDFLNKKVDVFELKDKEEAGDHPYSIELDPGPDKPAKLICYDSLKIEEVNSIKMELELFARAIKNNSPTPVTVEDGYDSLNLAYLVLEKIRKNKMMLS